MKDKDIKERLFSAISEQNVELVRDLLAGGADPNAVSAVLRDSALCAACDSWHTSENRFLMVEALLDAGADPKQVDESGYGVLFSSVIAKDTKLIAYLLSRGADPNLEHDLGEALYDWAEFDYRYDEYDLNLPEKPTEEVQSTPPSTLTVAS